MVIREDSNQKNKSKSRRKVSARDVAEIAGVSQSTVSRVLSGKGNDFISEKTRRRVIEISDQMGYRPDPIARALRGKKSYLLGLIVREIADPFFAKFIAELSAQARKVNYHIVLAHAQSDSEEALKMTDVLDTRHTDGVFLLGDLRGDESALQDMLRHNYPVVGLCRGNSDVSIYTINSDNYAGTHTLLEYLYELGHRRMGFINGGWLGDIRERREAFSAYLLKKGLSNQPERIQSEMNSAGGGYRAMMRLLDLDNRPTAVFASDDVMAIGALKAASDIKVIVPNEISIAGFDNIEFAQFMCPSLTTMHQSIDELCAKALQLMLELVDGEMENISREIIRIQPEMKIRQSTGPVPKGG